MVFVYTHRHTQAVHQHVHPKDGYGHNLQSVFKENQTGLVNYQSTNKRMNHYVLNVCSDR